MSDPQSKAYYSKIKDLRQGLPQHAVIHGKRKKIHKPFQVWFRYVWISAEEPPKKQWLLHGHWKYSYSRFATLGMAQQYGEKELRSFGDSPRYRMEFEVRKMDDSAHG